MRRDALSWRHSLRPRRVGVALLPLMLAIALPACSRVVCNAALARIGAPGLTVSDGVVYTAGGALTALHADTGALAWHSSSSGWTTPLLAGGDIITTEGPTSTGLHVGMLVAYHIADGSVAWHSQPVPRPWSGYSPQMPGAMLAGDAIYAAASPDSVAAWRVSDGSLLWQSPPMIVPTEVGYTSGYAPVPEPVVAGDAVYYSAGQSVHAVSAADGRLLWTSAALQPDNIYIPPAIADGRVFIAARDGSLYALSADSGAILWHAPGQDASAPPGVSPPATPAIIALTPDAALLMARDGVVYFTSAGDFRALAADTGIVLWHLSTDNPRRPGLEIADGVAYVAVGDYSSTLWALNARTGAVRWRASNAPTGEDGLLVSGGAVYTTSTGGVAAWRASDGAPLWQHKLQSGASLLGEAIFADGTLSFSMTGMGECGGNDVLPTVGALRASDGTLLWQTSVPDK